MLQRFLGLTEDEIAENERMWREEREDVEQAAPAGSDLRSVGVSPAGMESDIAMGQDVSQNMTPAGAPGTDAGGVPGAGAGAPVAPGGPGGTPGV